MTTPENTTPENTTPPYMDAHGQPADLLFRPPPLPPETDATEAFDAAEREMWQGRTEAYAGSFARLCAHPVQALLDAAGVGAGTRVLDVGTGTGTAAVAARARGARVSAVDADAGMVAAARGRGIGAQVDCLSAEFTDEEWWAETAARGAAGARHGIAAPSFLRRTTCGRRLDVTPTPDMIEDTPWGCPRSCRYRDQTMLRQLLMTSDPSMTAA